MAWSMVGLTLLSLGFVALTTGLVFLAWWLVEGPVEYTTYSAVVALAGAAAVYFGWRILKRPAPEEE